MSLLWQNARSNRTGRPMPKKEDLFRKAIELSGDDREQFLNSLSEDQRDEVDRMMNAAADAANRMGTPAPPLPDFD